VTDVRWLDGIIKWDPDPLSRVEYFLGPLAIDWADNEALGSIFRPPLVGPARGQLRPEVVRLVVRLAIDIYHGDPRRQRDYSVSGIALELDLGHATVAHLLAQRFATTRPVVTADRAFTEYGTYYLAANDDASAYLLWERQRPEWALPQPSAAGLDHLLDALLDRLICDTSARAIVAALEPIVAGTGCELLAPRSHTTWGEHGMALTFRPPIAIECVARALRLEQLSATSGDVHMSSWQVEAAEARPRIGPWQLDITLEGWPRAADHASLDELPNRGASPRFDLARCVTRVTTICVRPPRG
jgi:hypothetical protein